MLWSTSTQIVQYKYEYISKLSFTFCCGELSTLAIADCNNRRICSESLNSQQFIVSLSILEKESQIQSTRMYSLDIWLEYRVLLHSSTSTSRVPGVASTSTPKVVLEYEHSTRVLHHWFALSFRIIGYNQGRRKGCIQPFSIILLMNTIFP